MAELCSSLSAANDCDREEGSPRGGRRVKVVGDRLWSLVKWLFNNQLTNSRDRHPGRKGEHYSQHQAKARKQSSLMDTHLDRRRAEVTGPAQRD